MARYVSFIINSGAKIKDFKKPQTIYFRFRRNEIDFIRSTGFKVMINPTETKSDWDNNHKRVKDRTHILDRHIINGHLDALENHFKAFLNDNRQKGIIPSLREIKAHYNEFFTDLNEVDRTHKRKINEFIEEYSQRMAIIKTRSKGTIRNYIKLKNKLEDFKRVKGSSLNFEDIDLSWYNSFVSWLEGSNYKPNYIGDLIKNIKLFMSIAVEEGISSNVTHKNRSFVKFTEETSNTYLTEDEVLKLYSLDLSEEKSLDILRDLFLLGCYTGLRVSDYTNLNTDNIHEANGRKYLIVKPQKTKRKGLEVVIPLRPEAENILNKYDFNVPKRTPEHINRNLESICRRAKLNQLVSLSNKEEKIKKYKLIKTHTGRRTFCTNAYLTGLPVLEIMNISGHKTETSFLKYIKITPMERAERMAKTEFFNR